MTQSPASKRQSSLAQARGLLAHDVLIAGNTARAVLKNRTDALTVLFGLPLILAIALSQLFNLDERQAGLVLAALAFAVSFAATRLALSRTRYHATTGLLAEAALSRSTALPFMLAIVVPALAPALALKVAVGGTWTLFLAALVTGIVTATVAHLLLSPPEARSAFVLARWTSLNESLEQGAKQWVLPAGLVLAMAAASLIPAHSSAMTVAGAACILCSVLASSVCDQTIRYMLLSGVPVRRTLWRSCRQLVAIGLVALIAGPVRFAGVEGIFLASVPLLALWVKAVRVLAYGAFPKRSADMVVSIVLVTCIIAVVTVPPLVLLVAGFALASLWRRAQANVWLIA